jgi:homoserine O-acetyltransferase/O-succinyltransferase
LNKAVRVAISALAVVLATTAAPARNAAAAKSKPAARPAATPAPPPMRPREGDFVLRDFKFRSGESLTELKIHYLTLGRPLRDSSGSIVNAVLVLHGTGGTGRQFLSPQFANVLYPPGGLLDTTRTYVILPDGIGHGRSSKPSDGLKMKFPKYDYDDMVEAQYRLVTEYLGVKKLRLVMGTSMGGMHTWVWGETHPDAMRALMPLGCNPIEIAGRNRLWRAMVLDAIKSDPAWHDGDYVNQPSSGLRAAADLLIIAGTAPARMQREMPKRDSVESYLDRTLPARIAQLDANDLIYQVDASRNYNPEPDLEKITAPLVWVNSGDDFINPPELGIAEMLMPRVKHGRYVLVPASDKTHGHGTHTWAEFWKDELAALLKDSEGP